MTPYETLIRVLAERLAAAYRDPANWLEDITIWAHAPRDGPARLSVCRTAPAGARFGEVFRIRPNGFATWGFVPRPQLTSQLRMQCLSFAKRHGFKVEV